MIAWPRCFMSLIGEGPEYQRYVLQRQSVSLELLSSDPTSFGRASLFFAGVRRNDCNKQVIFRGVLVWGNEQRTVSHIKGRAEEQLRGCAQIGSSCNCEYEGQPSILAKLMVVQCKSFPTLPRYILKGFHSISIKQSFTTKDQMVWIAAVNGRNSGTAIINQIVDQYHLVGWKKTDLFQGVHNIATIIHPSKRFKKQPKRGPVLRNLKYSNHIIRIFKSNKTLGNK